MKNTLAAITSLATRMSRTSRTIEEFHGAFLPRVAAMGRVHDLLAGGAWTGARLRSVVEAAVAPYVSAEAGNLRLAGDEIVLPPNAVATVGMVLNELATNASKYGALSVPSGRVEVTWESLGVGPAQRRVRLSWAERDGPPVDGAPQSGFGTGFITRSMEYELNGTADLAFTSEGLHCEIEFPLPHDLERRLRTGGGDAQR